MLKSTLFLLRIAGIFSIIYFFIIAFYSGIRTSFLWIWPLVSMGSIALIVFFKYAAKHSSRSLNSTSYVLLVLLWLGFMILFGTECTLIRTGNTPPTQKADYVIVLGAQVRGDIPSLTLQARIDTAAAYLSEHPDCIAICSGGQGNGESISEAAAIQQGLIAQGIAPERILLENSSTNTLENLQYSLQLLPSSDTPIVLVTSSFHCYRAVALAKTIGYTQVEALGAGQFLATTPHYYFREFFALIKEYLVGNLSFF